MVATAEGTGGELQAVVLEGGGNGLDRRPGGDGAEDRHHDLRRFAAAVICHRLRQTAAAAAAARALVVGGEGRRFGHGAHDLDRPGAMFQSADEAALLQGFEQPMHARFRPDVQCVLHLVERGGVTLHPQMMVEIPQQLRLFIGEHDTPYAE